VPYFDSETEKYINRITDMKDLPVEKASCEPYVQFKRLIDLEKLYNSSGSIHVPRSLDQSYHFGLEAVEDEDSVEQEMDQVIYKYMKKQLSYLSLGNSDQQSEKEDVYQLPQKRQCSKEKAQANFGANRRPSVDMNLSGSSTASGASVDKPTAGHVSTAEIPCKQAKILMVNQLWLWILDDSKLNTVQPNYRYCAC
jgi:hypothetical protein